MNKVCELPSANERMCFSGGENVFDFSSHFFICLWKRVTEAMV